MFLIVSLWTIENSVTTGAWENCLLLRCSLRFRLVTDPCDPLVSLVVVGNNE
jgi:hypothetical protein